MPKAVDERRRRNKPLIAGDSVRSAGRAEYPVPEPDPEWHHAILRVWRGVVASPQSHQFFQPSDWEYAWYLCDCESGNRLAPRPSAMQTQTFISGMSDLLVTEGARRRLRIELERGKPEDDAPQRETMNKYRTSLKVVS